MTVVSRATASPFKVLWEPRNHRDHFGLQWPDWRREQSKSVIASMADAPTFHSSIRFTAKDSNKGFSYHEIFNAIELVFLIKICISASDHFYSSNLSIQCNNVIVIWVDQNKFPSVFTLSASRNHLRTSN